MPSKDGTFKGIAVPKLPKGMEQPKRDELAIQAKMLEAWKREQKTSGPGWPD